PDVNPGNAEAEEKFKEISQAYAILGDPEKRARYDQTGSVDEQSFNGGDFFGGGGFGDLFEAFFGGGQAPRARGGARDGEDIRAQVIVELIDVLESSEKPVKFRRSARCEVCQGMGTSDGSRP